MFKPARLGRCGPGKGAGTLSKKGLSAGLGWLAVGVREGPCLLRCAPHPRTDHGLRLRGFQEDLLTWTGLGATGKLCGCGRACLMRRPGSRGGKDVAGRRQALERPGALAQQQGGAVTSAPLHQGAVGLTPGSS